MFLGFFSHILFSTCWCLLQEAIQPGSIHLPFIWTFNFQSCELNQPLFFINYKLRVFVIITESGLILTGKLAPLQFLESIKIGLEFARVQLYGYNPKNKNSNSNCFVASAVVSTKERGHMQTQPSSSNVFVVEPNDVAWSVIYPTKIGGYHVVCALCILTGMCNRCL